MVSKDKLKRYLVFGYDDYFASGGLGDIGDSFDDKESAIKYAGTRGTDYITVWDRIEDVIVWEKRDE